MLLIALAVGLATLPRDRQGRDAAASHASSAKLKYLSLSTTPTLQSSMGGRDQGEC